VLGERHWERRKICNGASTGQDEPFVAEGVDGGDEMRQPGQRVNKVWLRRKEGDGNPDMKPPGRNNSAVTPANRWGRKWKPFSWSGRHIERPGQCKSVEGAHALEKRGGRGRGGEAVKQVWNREARRDVSPEKKAMQLPVGRGETER